MQPPKKPKFRLVLVTAPSELDARALATGVVEARLAACASLVPGLTSIYWWKDEVQTEAETLLLIKTTEALLPDLEAWIIEAHPYDVPEFIVLAMDGVNKAYGDWLAQNVKVS
jgi:periplasmic divalent cation tolerance protein